MCLMRGWRSSKGSWKRKLLLRLISKRCPKISLDHIKMANEAIVSSIEKLESSLNNKNENTIHIVSEITDIRQMLETPIKLNPSKNYKVAIKYFACYTLIDNITSENNEFHYKLNGRYLINE